MEISRAQADRLGKTLRHDDLTEDLLTQLNAYRDQVVNVTAGAADALRALTGYAVNPRDGKSTASIVAKLRRQTISLSRMQDVVGCRIVVDTIVEQEALRLRFAVRFPGAKLVDRRLDPSHGYRAVHFILSWAEQPYEVQIRSRLQHAWAQTVERLSDTQAPDLKYGTGPQELTRVVTVLSNLIADFEALELTMFASRDNISVEASETGVRIERVRTETNELFTRLLEKQWST